MMYSALRTTAPYVSENHPRHPLNEPGLFKQTVFLVLPGELAKGSKSCLYDATFTHERRQGTAAP